jgi:hypothetical protein
MRTMAMLVGVLMATGAMAQETEAPARRNVVALDVGGLLQNTIGVSAERALSDRVSVRLGARAGLTARWMTNTQTLASGLGSLGSVSSREVSLALEPGARFFLTGRAPEGFWVGPQLGLSLGWSHVSFESNEPSGGLASSGSRSLLLSGSALAGYSAVLGKGLALQAAAGLGVSQWRPLGTTGAVMGGFGGSKQWTLEPVTQLSLGYAF